MSVDVSFRFEAQLNLASRSLRIVDAETDDAVGGPTVLWGPTVLAGTAVTVRATNVARNRRCRAELTDTDNEGRTSVNTLNFTSVRSGPQQIEITVSNIEDNSSSSSSSSS